MHLGIQFLNVKLLASTTAQVQVEPTITTGHSVESDNAQPSIEEKKTSSAPLRKRESVIGFKLMILAISFLPSKKPWIRKTGTQ